MVQGASLFQLGKGLYRRGFFPTRVLVKGLWLQAYFRMEGREKPGHIEDVRGVTLGFIEGHTVTELTDAIAELRELARGVRPAGLDDGLATALQELATRSPVRTRDSTASTRRSTAGTAAGPALSPAGSGVGR